MYQFKAEMGLPFICQSQYEMFPHRQLTLYCKLLTFFLFCMGEIKFIFQLKKATLVLVCFVFHIRDESPQMVSTSSKSAVAFSFRQLFVYRLEGQNLTPEISLSKIFQSASSFIFQFHRRGTHPL